MGDIRSIGSRPQPPPDKGSTQEAAPKPEVPNPDPHVPVRGPDAPQAHLPDAGLGLVGMSAEELDAFQLASTQVSGGRLTGEARPEGLTLAGLREKVAAVTSLTQIPERFAQALEEAR